MKKAILFVFYMAILFGLAFALARFLEENSQMASLRFMFWRTKEISMGYLVSFSFLSGLILSGSVLIGSLMSKSLEARRLRRENAALQRVMDKTSVANTDHSNSSNVITPDR